MRKLSTERGRGQGSRMSIAVERHFVTGPSVLAGHFAWGVPWPRPWRRASLGSVAIHEAGHGAHTEDPRRWRHEFALVGDGAPGGIERD